MQDRWQNKLVYLLQAVMCVPSDTPMKVITEAGEVIVDGGNGIVASFTPAAAEATSDRFLDAAAEAQGQTIVDEMERD